MLKNQTNHLYIHIPFCKQICTYCDFYRTKTNDEKIKSEYVLKIIKQINEDNNLYKTIYIGGGTPNFLNEVDLNNLLYACQNKLAKQYEFSIECNPEFVDKKQVAIFKKNKVNRVSLGVQTVNESILKLLKREHTNQDVIRSLELLKQANIDNVSIDLIYNLPLLKNQDLKDAFKLIKQFDVKHISFYSLEIKEGSILKKMNYKIDTNKEEDQLELIKQDLSNLGLERYEVSNWAKNKNYYSQHNIAYWNLNDWKAIGVSGYGYQNGIYYHNVGNINKWSKNDEIWSLKDLYENIFIMGLRTMQGIDLTIKRNLDAYNFLKDKINHNLVVVENNFIKAKNIDLLHEILIDLI